MLLISAHISDKPLTNIELSTYARELEISHVRDVFMRDALPLYPFNIENGILNFNTSNQAGSHWVCYYRKKTDRIYLDSYGQITPVEIHRYLKTGSEFYRGKEVIQGNTDIIQAENTSVCDHLCLFVLNTMDIHKMIRNISFKPKKGFVLPKHRYTGPFNPIHLQLDSKDNPLPGNEPYNVVDATSLRHEICYRDNPTGKHECDRKMKQN